MPTRDQQEITGSLGLKEGCHHEAVRIVSLDQYQTNYGVGITLYLWCENCGALKTEGWWYDGKRWSRVEEGTYTTYPKQAEEAP